MLQYSRDAVLHQPHGVRWGRRAANIDTTQAFPCQHSHRKCYSRYKLANFCSGCSSEPGTVSLSACVSAQHCPKTDSALCHTEHVPPVMRVAHGDVDTCSLVVVLERRTLVHDLKTLELLRTLETPANPKVCHISICDN